MSRPLCRSHLLGGGLAPPFVDTLGDAVFVVDASVGGTPSFGSVALLLGGDDRLLTAIESRACDTAARAVDLCSVLVAASAPAGSWQRLVLATSFEAAVADWHHLVAAVAPAPVEVVDWLEVDLAGGRVRSLREVAEGRSPW